MPGKRIKPVRVTKPENFWHQMTLLVSAELFHKANAVRGKLGKTWREVVEEALTDLVDEYETPRKTK